MFCKTFYWVRLLSVAEQQFRVFFVLQTTLQTFILRADRVRRKLKQTSIHTPQISAKSFASKSQFFLTITNILSISFANVFQKL
jgi:hypothetical protein